MQTENNDQLGQELNPESRLGSNGGATAVAGNSAGYYNEEEISNRNEEGETAEVENDETLAEDDEWDEDDTMGDGDDIDAEDRA
jgi:hypothetical protein